MSAKSPAALGAMIVAHQNFCRKFRMRTNPDKSKLMRFTRCATGDEFSLTVGGLRFSTPEKKAGQDRCVQKFLGFALDSGLTGRAHVKRQLGAAKARCRSLDVISRYMGERMALWYLRTTVAPSVLFAMELVPARLCGADLRAVHTLLIAEAVRLGDKGGNPVRSTPVDGAPVANLRRDGLVSETSELPWDIEVSKRALRLLGGLNRARGSGSLAAAVLEGGAGRQFVQRAEHVAATWGVSTWPDPDEWGMRRWKATLKEQAGLAAAGEVERLKVARSSAAGRAVDDVYVRCMSDSRDDAARWDALLVDPAVRRTVRELKIGAIPEVRANVVKRFGEGRKEHWNRLGRFDRAQPPGFGQTQQYCLGCPCRPAGQQVVQDAAHVLLECAYSEAARVAALRAADVFVSCLGQVAVRAWWDWKGSAAKLWYLLQPQSEIDARVDRQLRGLALGAWVRAMVPVRAQVAAVNVGFGELVSGMARRVAAL